MGPAEGERERERESREISGCIAPTALQRQVLEMQGLSVWVWGMGAGEKNRSLCLFEDLRNPLDSETLHKIRGISNLTEHVVVCIEERVVIS
jgi:hypothetical protein